MICEKNFLLKTRTGYVPIEVRRLIKSACHMQCRHAIFYLLLQTLGPVCRLDNHNKLVSRPVNLLEVCSMTGMVGTGGAFRLPRVPLEQCNLASS